MQKLTIFVSSPGDVGQERLLAERVIDRLQGEFRAVVELQPIFWEDKPMEASNHFQTQIADYLYKSDIVLCVLWQRLGTQLPPDYARPDGTPYLSGTEWEFETAINLYKETGRPTVLVYKKTKRPELHLYEGEERQQRVEQLDRLQEFWSKWFGDHKAGFKAAYTGFEDTDAFEEKLETHLREVIKKNIPAIIAEGDNSHTPPNWFSGSPFRGLETFNEEHSAVFFGRTKAISEIKDCLIRKTAGGCSFLLILGRSGCGKSSLVRAGLIPTLTHPGVVEKVDAWYYAVYRPGDYGLGLFEGLPAALAGNKALPSLLDGWEEAPVILQTDPQAFISRLQEAMQQLTAAKREKLGLSRQPTAKMLLYIDQFEELFSLERYSLEMRRKFLEILEVMASSGSIWVIASMRSDLYGLCCEEPILARLKNDGGQYDLLPPSFAEIASIIQKPTYAAGLRFEHDPRSGQRLDEVLHEAAAANPSALPLLEFTLAELYQRRSGNILTFAAYQSLGGMEGALAFYAEDVFKQQEVSCQLALPKLLRLLVSIDREEEKIISNRVMQLQLTGDTALLQLTQVLVKARLLVSDQGEGGAAMFGVAHEALLRCWPRVQQWLEAERSFLRSRAWLNEEALNWQREGCRREYLLQSGKPLQIGRETLAGYREYVSALIVDFVNASWRHFCQQRLRRRLLAAAALISFLAFGFAFLRTSWGDKLVELRHDVETVIEGRLDIAMAEKFDKIDQRVTFVDIDNAAFNAWGKPAITPRDKIADMVDMLSEGGAKIIVFDIFFDEPDYQQPERDSKLRQALQRVLNKPDGPKVIFPTMIYADGNMGKTLFDDLIDEKQRFFRGVPYILVKSDYDSKIRYWSPYGLCHTASGQRRVLWGTPLLAAVLAAGDSQQLSGVEQSILSAEGQGGNSWQKQLFAVDLQNQGKNFAVKFSFDGKNEGQRIKYYMIPQGVVTPADPGNLFWQSAKVSEAERMNKLSKSLFRGKIVIVGNSAPDKGDNKPTPVGTMPGMYVLGNIINNLLKGL